MTDLTLSFMGLRQHMRLALDNAIQNDYWELLTWKPGDVLKDLRELDAIMEANVPNISASQWDILLEDIKSWQLAHTMMDNPKANA